MTLGSHRRETPGLRGKALRLARTDAAGLVSVGLVSQVLAIASGPFVARMLGPGGRGEVVTILAAALLSNQLLLTSLGGGIARTVARHQEPARDVVGRFVRGWILWATLAASISAGITGLVLRRADDILVLVVLGLVITLMGGVLSLVRAMVLGEDSIRKVNRADLSFTVTYVAGVVLLFAFRRDSTVPVVMLCYLAGQLVSILLMTRSLRPGTGKVADASVRAEVHQFARRAYFGSIGTLDRLGVDSILLGHLLGTAVLGLYSVGSSIAALPALVVGSLAVAVLPKMAAREPREGAALLRRWLAGALILVLPVVIVLWLAIEPILRILFGAEFVPAAWAGRLLLVANTAFAVRLMLTSAAAAQGRERSASVLSLLSSLVLVGALVLGAHLGGLEGAALGVMVAALGACVAIGSVVSWTGRGVKPPTPVSASE